jgi:hypothetical protein
LVAWSNPICGYGLFPSPDRMVAELLHRLDLQLPTRTKLIENV